jgi:hypothetical protein
MYKGEASQNEKADKVVCDICTQSCNGATPTKSRAQNVTNKAIDVLLNNSHIAIPIYSFSCDYTYQGSFTAYYNIVFNPSPPAQGNVCGIAYCGGCSRSGNDTCFHQECSSSITDLMTQVATQTGGGSYINLANLQTLSGVIQTNVFREIDEYKISAGTKRSALVQYSVSRVLPLPNNLGASATLTVYTD